MKCYFQLHLSIEFDNGFVDQKMDDDNSLNIFQMTPRTIEHETMFPTTGFLARHILRIVDSQIEIERIFSLAEIFTNLRRCHL
jgi:hypothetical protein